MLVVFKSAPILKRALKVKQAMMQLYVLKLLKMQVATLLHGIGGFLGGTVQGGAACLFHIAVVVPALWCSSPSEYCD